MAETKKDEILMSDDEKPPTEEEIKKSAENSKKIRCKLYKEFTGKDLEELSEEKQIEFWNKQQYVMLGIYNWDDCSWSAHITTMGAIGHIFANIQFQKLFNSEDQTNGNLFKKDNKMIYVLCYDRSPIDHVIEHSVYDDTNFVLHGKYALTFAIKFKKLIIYECDSLDELKKKCSDLKQMYHKITEKNVDPDIKFGVFDFVNDKWLNIYFDDSNEYLYDHYYHT
jgi:hypothetical protein